MTKEQAIELHDSKFWEDMSPDERAQFQLFEDKLCMPFEVFHEAVEKTLGRPVFTHEFGFDRDGLKKELLGARPAPTLVEVMALIPEDKRVIVVSVEKAAREGASQ